MRERGTQKKIQLQSILLTDGTTAADYLAGEPAAWRKIEEAAIFACLEKGWPLHVGNIQYMARELQLNKKPSLWSRLKKRLRVRSLSAPLMGAAANDEEKTIFANRYGKAPFGERNGAVAGNPSSGRLPLAGRAHLSRRSLTPQAAFQKYNERQKNPKIG